MEWRARALIDGRALRHNLAAARRHARGCRVMAVVKSNAYGHGLAEVSCAIGGANGVDAFAVATLDEGIDCRAANPNLPVTILSGLLRPGDLAVCREHRLAPVLHCEEHLQWLERDRGALDGGVWLKIDTGMNRLGIAPEQVADAVARLQLAGIKTIRLMSHLACADDADDDYTTAQLKRFKRATDQCAMEKSLANSAAVMQWPQTHFDCVRPGLMLYGGSPLLGAYGPQLRLKPAMQLQARLVAVKTARKGEPIGYGGDFTAPKRMRIGVVGFGYGDGYPRAVNLDRSRRDNESRQNQNQNRAAVLIAGRRAPLAGRVSMDLLTVDLSRHERAAIGDEVTLWGEGLSVDEVAEWAGATAYELLCNLSERVARIGVE